MNQSIANLNIAFARARGYVVLFRIYCYRFDGRLVSIDFFQYFEHANIIDCQFTLAIANVSQVVER
jgi:hypothetical protein